MANEGKKSFLLYFDAYPMVSQLSSAQRGELLSALFEYAQGAAQEEGCTLQTVLQAHPEMDPDTRMAYFFMGDTIRRDTEKWWEKHRRYQAAAARRRQEEEIMPAAAMERYVANLRSQQ